MRPTPPRALSAAVSSTRDRLRRFAWRPLPFLALGAALFAWGPSVVGSDRASSLGEALAARGLRVSEITWLDPAPASAWQSALHPCRAIVRARASSTSELHDIYLVRARLSPEGRLVSVTDISDLTRTPGADESAPLVDGQLVVYTAVVDGVTTSVYAVDVSHELETTGDDLTQLGRVQIALTNLQETGQLSGVTRRGWTFDPSPTSVRVALDSAGIHVVADGRDVRLARSSTEAESAAVWVRPHPTARARPGNLVTWAVDRARAISWFGDEKMQALKAAAFGVLDVVSRFERSLAADTSAKDIAADMGDLARVRPQAYTDPETGWPPAPMVPFVMPTLSGEGEWVPLDADPFILTNPGAPPAFVTSFIRADRERLYTRVYVTLWDPRQVEMHMMAGTVEPIGASGETGPGLIPRTPEIIGRVVGAMNGGFQAMHGEFGMMGDGIVYLPPKPYAATVAAMRDGSTGFGEWPLDEGIPDDIVSFRQNLTVLVKDEKWNPYGRTWWGGTPPGQTDKVHTVRSGTCLTRENFVGYFYGQEIAADVLAQAMIRARCKFGIHLDMNVGHTGLEFYRVAPAAELGPIGRPLQGDWQAEGRVPGLDGWNFRGRRMVRSMPLMNFPRYIHRESRDFLYLTLRHVLPGADLAGLPGEQGKWQTKGLPQHGFPFALATSFVRGAGDARIHLLKIDPRVVAAQGAPGVPVDAPTVVVFSGITRTGAAHPRLWLAKGAFTITAAEQDGATELLSGLSLSEAENSPAVTAALGIADEDGMLVYAELGSPTSGARASELDDTLAKLGCTTRMLLPRALRPALGGTTALDGTAALSPEGATVRLVRRQAPSAHTIFDDTPVVPPEVWQPLQMRRVRYFKKPLVAAPTKAATAPPAQGDADPPNDPDDVTR